MALTTAEVARIKYELGYNVLTVGAEPFIGVTEMFENVIAPYTQAGASTTSATPVLAASPVAVAAVTLASATGFAAGNRVVIDVEDAQEITTVRSISGAVISVFLTKAHPAGYPVTVEGGEAIIREILEQLRRFSEPRGLLWKAVGTAGIKKVDDVEFFDTGLTSRSRTMRQEQTHWRDELASALGCENMRNGSSGSAIAMY